MTPEEFYRKNNIIKYSQQTIKEMRVRSLDWMLNCFRNGTIRRRTIINLIPLVDLYKLLSDMEDIERYEDCLTIKTVIDEIYEQTNLKTEDMSKKRRKEIIGLLENTIRKEHEKVGGGNKDIIKKLSEKLDSIKNKK